MPSDSILRLPSMRESKRQPCEPPLTNSSKSKPSTPLQALVRVIFLDRLDLGLGADNVANFAATLAFGIRRWAGHCQSYSTDEKNFMDFMKPTET